MPKSCFPPAPAKREVIQRDPVISRQIISSTVPRAGRSINYFIRNKREHWIMIIDHFQPSNRISVSFHAFFPLVKPFTCVHFTCSKFIMNTQLISGSFNLSFHWRNKPGKYFTPSKWYLLQVNVLANSKIITYLNWEQYATYRYCTEHL